MAELKDSFDQLHVTDQKRPKNLIVFPIKHQNSLQYLDYIQQYHVAV